ncbi:hypothetical protein SprV_0401603200 [Sparganum proliferum]
MKWPAGFPRQAKPAEHRLELSRSSPQYHTQDVQSSHPADAAVWSGDLDGVQESAEVARRNPGLGRTGTDRNPQHLRHDEKITTTLEQPPRADGRGVPPQNGFDPTGRLSQAPQGCPEDFLEAPADQPGQLGRPRPGLTDLEESSEDRRAIYEANRITAAKAKTEARKSQLRPIINANARPSLT